MNPLRSISLLITLALLLVSCQSQQITPQATLWPTQVRQTSTPEAESTDPQSATRWPTQDWQTSTPEAEGMDPQLLADALAAVKRENIYLYSLLVIRNGAIVSETYFKGDDAGTRRDLYSCTKSFTSTLIGIAIDQGLIQGVDRPLSDFLPVDTYANPDPRKSSMTLENILTMSSGLDWTENNGANSSMSQSSDWTKWLLDEPMREEPGTQFNYCTGCSHVLTTILDLKTNGGAANFASTRLLNPLGITNAVWQKDAQGIPAGGWGLRLTPREMAKLGYLYLHQGQWDGEQIVSPAWVQAATQKHIGTGGNLAHGYQWWIYPKFGAYAALGYGGQTIFVVPNKNLVIVTTAHILEGGHDPIFKLIDKYIVPAAKD